ncbi:MAG: O-antigen ligase family protein [Chloroflexi bacterium]|nr:O-antigen ligase family protein [Chloroflexota bacterium]
MKLMGGVGRGRLNRVALALDLRGMRKFMASRELAMALMAGGIMLFYAAPSPVWPLAGLLLYAVPAYSRMELGLPFVMLSAPFYLVPKQFGTLQFSLTEALLVTCAGLWGLRLLLDRSKRQLLPLGYAPARLDLAILVFVVAGALSIMVAERPREALRELRTVVLEPVALYYLILVAAKSKRDVFRLADALIVAGVLVSLIGLYQYAFTDQVITAEGVRRMRALYGSPNHLGLFLGRVLPLAVCLTGGAFVKGSRVVYYGAGSALMVISLALTFSLGAWLAVLLAMLFVAVVVGRRRLLWTLTGLAGLAAGGMALVPWLQIERISSHFGSEGTTALRLYIWQASLNMLRDHPLLGVGLDNFLNQYPRYMLPAAWREPYLSHPHNLVLDFWLRTGTLGLLAALWLLGWLFVAGTRLYRRLPDPLERALILGLLAGMVDFVVHGSIDNSYFLVDLAIIFWASLAAIRILETERELA